MEEQLALPDVFDALAVDYQTVDDAPDNGAYHFVTRYPSVNEEAVADFGRYLAVVDATVEAPQDRWRVYRNIRAGADQCYLPDDNDVPAAVVADLDTLRDAEGLKQWAANYLLDDGDVARFSSAYDAVKSSLNGEER